jgi:hypothetical protein
MSERGRNLFRDLQNPLRRKPASFRPVQEVGDVTSRHELAHDKQGFVFLEHVVDRDDVRMVTEPGHRLCLALHAGPPGFIETFHLDPGDGDLTVE